MRDRNHRESLAPSPASTASAQRQTNAVESKPRYKRTCEEQEEESSQSLQNLQECICELLIKNQELRMSLQHTATNHRPGEADQ